MFNIQNYKLGELQDMLEGKEEISQENNFNAYTRLFITDEKTVIKLYVSSPERAQRNIENLMLLRNRNDLENLCELVMPTSLISIQNKIVGFSMPYIQGCSLNTFLSDRHISDKLKFSVFEQLAHLICKMPEDVFMGDLHGGNVLVDSDCKIHLIDIDGFSLKDGYQMTVPHLPDVDRKYKRADGTDIISRESDIYCFYRLFLYWISDSPLALEEYHRGQYLQYLLENGAAQELVSDIERLFFQKIPNTLNFHLTRQFCNHISYFKYETFLNNTGLIEREKMAEYILDKYCM